MHYLPLNRISHCTFKCARVHSESDTLSAPHGHRLHAYRVVQERISSVNIYFFKVAAFIFLSLA